MANEIWYGDPGLEPDNKTIYPNRALQRWRRNVSYPLGGSPTNLQFDYDPGWASGEVDVGEGLFGPWLQNRAAFMGGLRYGGEQQYGFSPEAVGLGGLGVSQPNVGQFGLGGVPANVSTPVAFDYGRYGLDRPPTDASTPGAYSPPHSLQLGTEVGYQPGGEGGGPEDQYGEGVKGYMKYLGAQTGRHGGELQAKSGVPGHEGEEYTLMVRKDAYGNVISFTPVSGQTRERALRSSYHTIGGTRGSGRSFLRRRWQDRPGREGVTNRNKYATPDWIKSMSNWRGI